MSTSEAETSDSNMESPFSQGIESPYSSPSQQVPQLTSNISQLSWLEKSFGQNVKQPELVIVAQPQNHFRFRYKSEMIGTHGCLLGKSLNNSKTKTHPTVELKNYTGKALIRCRLARHDSPDEHPHKLLEDEQDHDVNSVVPRNGSYRIAFSGMGIIHTAKKDVPELLFKKYAQETPGSKFNENKLRTQAENDAKTINLNIVRLKFTAHDLTTDEEICPPVLSESIHNMKSAATNDLKICRISCCTGRAKGGEDIFIFVEKVNKKNIMINFFEVENGKRVWTDTGKFLQHDVHHQYAIVFRTPPYRDPDITTDVKVFLELARPTDGRTSEPVEFTYKAGYGGIHKKRKANSSYSSIESNSENSYKFRFSDLPTTINQNEPYAMDTDEIVKEMPTMALPQTPQMAATSDSMMADAMCAPAPIAQYNSFSPLLSQPNVPEAPVPILQLNSSELDRIVNRKLPSADERKLMLNTDLSGYFKQFSVSLDEDLPGTMADFLKSSMLVPDSGKPVNVKNLPEKDNVKNVKVKNEYTASYKYEDGVEVKKLVKELCEMIRNKSSDKIQLIRSKLERLFDMRLGNGDTFLHMTLASNQPSLEYIVKLIHNMRMIKLLNLKNYEMQTILHLAIVNDLPKLVIFLVSKGCNPMEEDIKGNNAVHYAVIHQSCLEALLLAIDKYGVSCDINAYNNDKQTALHLSAVFGSAESATSLLRRGARLDARDAAARTPIHLAVYDDCSAVLRVLLQNAAPDEIDAVDGKGYTALQIACASELRNNTLEIVKLLLEHKADPKKHEENNKPAWMLAHQSPEVLQLLQPYIDSQIISEDDIKSEPEDEYESAEDDEEEPSGLAELPLYMNEVCAALERSGAWRELARRLRRDALLSWFAATAHPARTLLNHVKDDEEITSKSLELLLKSMGETEAAAAIRKYI